MAPLDVHILDTGQPMLLYTYSFASAKLKYLLLHEYT